MNSIHATLIEDEGESRYKITDVIGNLNFFYFPTFKKIVEYW